MAKFTENAQPIYKTTELKNHDSDKLATELRIEAKQNIKDNFYIKRNMKTVLKIDKD
jgi:hypothetical protein